MKDEYTEWRCAVNDLSESDRAATEVERRMAAGICGEPEDALYGEPREYEE